MLPVLIVGAGPTGLTAALELSRFGIPVRIIDRLPTPRTSSRALGVQARTVELMAQRGLATQMLAAGNLGHAVNVYGNGQRAIHLDMSRIESRFNALLLLPQAQTELILSEAIGRAGVVVERGVELVGLAQAGGHAAAGATARGSGPHERRDPGGGDLSQPDPNMRQGGTAVPGAEAASAFAHAGQAADDQPAPVRAILRHSDGRVEMLDAAWLISAEGAHSVVRNTLAIPFEGSTLPTTFALGDLTMDPMLPADELHAFTSDQGVLAVFPFGGNRIRIVATTPAAHDRDHTEPPTLAQLQHLYDHGSHIPARLSDLTWSSWFRINSRMVGRLRAGHVLLGGDAAHIHSPIGGQGMNTGIQDMINLGWKLALVMQGRADPALIDTYEQERLPVMRSLLSTTEEITRVMSSGSALVRGVLTHVGPLVGSSGLVQSNAAARMSQIALGYRGSKLGVDHRPGGHLRAGDRVPDFAVQVQDSGAWRQAGLHDLLDPTGFVLLLVGDVAADPFAASDGLAQAGQAAGRIPSHHIRAAETPDDTALFRAAFGRSGGAFLVRPDGYLAVAAGERGALEQLNAFRAQWLRVN